jgi:hypothetical protein
MALTLTGGAEMFTLKPSMSRNDRDKTQGKFQVLKDGTKYCKLMKNGKTRESIMTGGLELWLTEAEANEAIKLYKEG